MSMDQESETGRAQATGQEVKRDLPGAVGLLALPVLAFHRNMLNLVRKGIEEAGLLKPVQNLLEHELHALFMILDPTGQWRNTRGAEIEKRLKDTLDGAVPKVISGSISLIDAQQAILTELIAALDTARKDKHPQSPKTSG